MHRHTKQQRQAALIILGVFSLIILSQLYLFYSVYDLRHDQEKSYEELKGVINSFSETYEEDISELRKTNSENLERMGQFIVETKNEYDKKTEGVIQAVERAEKKNDIQLAELREDLKNINNGAITELVNQVIKAAVSVSTNRSQGSGALISDDGYIVTNNHVVRGYSRATIIDFNGKAASAEVIITDPVRDLAILKTDKDFDHIPLGDSNEVLVGERVIAIGSPESLDFTVTQGIVSATNRVFNEEEGSFIQTDVPINSGSSGGPLINSKGQVIGINTFKIRGSESLGFAIPSNDIQELLNSINRSG